MKKTFILFFILTINFFSLKAQEFEWVVNNTYSNPGERIVAILDAGTVGTYDGVEIIGQVIDNNGNWGYNLPTVSNFSLYVKFSGGISYRLIQAVETSNINLRLRKISDLEFHLTANCPNYHTAMRILLKKVEGSVNVIMGDPKVNDASGELVISEPTYKSYVSGNFGIGTDLSSNPNNYKLAVNGTIGAKEIKVETTSWSDYVFDDKYKLQELKDLENYIKENRSLPNIPTEEEVIKNGINVAEMDSKLLQKIEELTLYLIEQNKRIEKLEKENESLKTKINIWQQINHLQ